MFGRCSRFLLSIVEDGPVLQKKVNNLVFVVPFGELDWSLSSLIFMRDVDSLLQQELDHFVATLLDSVIDRSLTVRVNRVEVRPC